MGDCTVLPRELRGVRDMELLSGKSWEVNLLGEVVHIANAKHVCSPTTLNFADAQQIVVSLHTKGSDVLKRFPQRNWEEPGSGPSWDRILRSDSGITYLDQTLGSHTGIKYRDHVSGSNIGLT